MNKEDEAKRARLHNARARFLKGLGEEGVRMVLEQSCKLLAKNPSLSVSDSMELAVHQARIIAQ